MTLTTIFDILGETIVELHTTAYGDKDYEAILKKAEYESKVAKQMVNIADITLRTDKMSGKTKRIDKVVG